MEADADRGGARAHLFICEAYSLTRPVRYHLHLPALSANRRDCKRLLLTHASPDVLDRSEVVDQQLAEDGTVIDL